jgi:hypothetical protein
VNGGGNEFQIELPSCEISEVNSTKFTTREKGEKSGKCSEKVSPKK